MSDLASQQEVLLGAQGRLVIPASLRAALGFAPGDKLVARTENGRLVLEKSELIKLRLKQRFTPAATRSLASELLEERREDTRREAKR